MEWREGGRKKACIRGENSKQATSVLCQNRIVIFFSVQKNWKSLQRRELEQKLITSFAFAYNWYAFRLGQ